MKVVEAAAIHELGSEVRLRLKEKAPSPKLGSPLPPTCSEITEVSLLCPAGEKSTGGGWQESSEGWYVAVTLIHGIFVPKIIFTSN